MAVEYSRVVSGFFKCKKRFFLICENDQNLHYICLPQISNKSSNEVSQTGVHRTKTYKYTKVYIYFVLQTVACHGFYM